LMAFRLLKASRRARKANIAIDGTRIEALNVANLLRKPNRTLKIHDAKHFARIDGSNLTLFFEYSGQCVSRKGENGIVFNIGSDVNIPFENLTCYGFNLRHDPRKTHKIRPFLVKDDGLAKKIRLPLIKNLAKGEEFHVGLVCVFPKCLQSKRDYVIATLAYESPIVGSLVVSIDFLREQPKWLRAYDVTTGTPGFIKDLEPKAQGDGSACYVDKYSGIEGEKALVYFFER